MTKLSQKRLVDRLMRAYISWREACLRLDSSDPKGSHRTDETRQSAVGEIVDRIDRPRNGTHSTPSLRSARQATELRWRQRCRWR